MLTIDLDGFTGQPGDDPPIAIAWICRRERLNRGFQGSISTRHKRSLAYFVLRLEDVGHVFMRGYRIGATGAVAASASGLAPLVEGRVHSAS